MASLKLRVRTSGGPTVKVQVPVLCSLQDFKEVIAPLISLPPSSFSLSLNKKDAIRGPGTALLTSFGVTSGDLLFYLEDSGGGLEHEQGASTSAAIPGTVTAAREVSIPGGPSTSMSVGSGTSCNSRISASRETAKANLRELCASAATRRATMQRPMDQSAGGLDSSFTAAPADSSIVPVLNAIAHDTQIAPNEEIVSSMTDGKEVNSVVERRLPIPDLLQRVLYREKGNIRMAPSYMILAVHAVMLETGFVRVDSGHPEGEGHELPLGWSSTGLVNLVYTLPELLILEDRVPSIAQGAEALLRCQIVGNSVVVYGAVTGGTVHRLSLSVKKFLLEDSKLWTAAHDGDNQKDSSMDDINQEGSRNVNATAPHRPSETPAVFGLGSEETVFCHVFDLWKDVKDSLSLPLLTFICEKAGLPPPPSLLRLPTELKIKVLDSLPAVALANLACVSSELRFLAASEDLWMKHYRKEFGAGGDRAPGGRGWKNAFVRDWEHRRRREEERREAERFLRNDNFPPELLRTPPFAPFGGLDYFHGMGGGSRGGFGGLGSDGGGGFRNYGFRVGPLGNPTAFGGNRTVGRLDFGFGGHRDGVACFSSVDFDGQGLRPWPSPNPLALRGTRSLGTYGGGRGTDSQSRRLDGDGDASLFTGLGPYR